MTPKQFIKVCLITAGVSFLSIAVICMLLYPEVFRHFDYGVSYFGSVHTTLIPYYFGFMLTITCVSLIAKRLWPVDKALSRVFWSIALCMTGVALTSYSLSHVVYAAHWVFAIALAVCILYASFWLLKRGGLARLDYLLIGIMVADIVISALPIVKDISLVRVYIPRELLVFTCSLWVFGRASLSVMD